MHTELSLQQVGHFSFSWCSNLSDDGVLSCSDIKIYFIVASVGIGKKGLAALEIWHGDAFRPRL